MVVLFTGMSGIAITDSLKKFCREFEEFKPSRSFYLKEPHIINLDSKIEDIYYEKNPNEIRSKRTWINKILLLPYPTFEEYWNNSLDKIADEIKNINDRHIFLNLHACYFHNKTQEYLSLVDLKNLKEKINPKFVITLIDDIYDIHQRLNDLGGIYHDYQTVSKTEMILRHLRLLDWRSKETMMSRYIAKQLEIENYVFAVKHSYKTLFNLVFNEENKKAYLSHPITEVRRLEKEKNPLADEIKKEIDILNESASQTFTTFSPTTIDEYRILNEIKFDEQKKINKKVYYSVLTKRWDQEKYIKEGAFLYWPSGFSGKNQLWEEDKSNITRIDDEINQLLATLSDLISDQVTTRDYTIVEQSDIIIIYRPFFNGNASGGVQEEFRYFKTLGKDLVFIYCPVEDVHKFYTRQLNYQTKHHINETKNLKIADSEEFKEFGYNIWENTNDKISTIDGLLEFLEQLFHENNINFNVMPRKAPLEKDNLMEFKTKFAEELLSSFSLVNEYKNNNDSRFTGEISSIQQWISNIYDIAKS
jgi:uncharacterized protein (UPF0335 family)